jgi:hypothetical protein
MTVVSAVTEAALRSAMHRLLTGKPQRTDGRLTVAGMAIEADISRATANRATAILDEFRMAVANREGKRFSPRVLKGQIGELKAKVIALKRRETDEIRQLRASAHTLAQHVQALTLHIAEQNRVIAELHEQLAHVDRAKVVPIARKA